MAATTLKLAGIFAPLTTPFAADGSVDLAALGANVRRYNATRLAGYVVAGSTGESVFLTEQETLDLFAAVREAAAPGKLLIAGTGKESTRGSIELARRAAALGYHAALVRTPFYFKPQMTEDALAHHYFAVADASPIPVLVYSVPQLTGITVRAVLMARIAEHRNIIGMKDSAGNVRQLSDIVQAAPKKFQVLVGAAMALLESLSAGARGGVLAAACALPELCVEVYDAFARGDREQARTLQATLDPPARAAISLYGIAGLKHAMDLRGYAGGPIRAPLLPLEATARAELDRVFQNLPAVE